MTKPNSDPHDNLSTRLKNLIVQAQLGDREAYRLLLQELRLKSVGIARAILNSSGNKKRVDPEDIAQEVLMAVHRSLHTYRPENDFLAWFNAIVRYKVIDSLRKSKETLRLDDESTDEITEAQWSDVSKDLGQVVSDSKRDLSSLLSCLPEKQRRVLELTKIEGRSISEVAKILSLTEVDVKVSTHRALKTLKAQSEKT